jgi:hypothetical protein
LPTDPYSFPGFHSPRYTQTPNELFDELLAPGRLTEAELRVLLYIVRRTFGFAKDADAISLSQLTDGIVKADGQRLDYGAGVGRDAASRAVKGLERKGCIVVTRHASRQHGSETNVYALRFRGDPQVSNQTPPVVQQDPPSPARPPAPVVQPDPQNDSPKDSQTEEDNSLLERETRRRLRAALVPLAAPEG